MLELLTILNLMGELWWKIEKELVNLSTTIFGF